MGYPPKSSKSDQTILWMEEILHHLGWLKPYNRINHGFQLVQDCFHPNYSIELHPSWGSPIFRQSHMEVS